MNEQQYEQLAAVCNGQYNWAEFRDRFKTYANTPENAEAFYDHLAVLLEEVGAKPQNFEYKLHTEYAPDDCDAYLFLELILIDQVETAKMEMLNKLAHFTWEVNAVDQTQFNLNPRAYALTAVGIQLSGYPAPNVMEVAGYSDKPKSDPVGNLTGASPEREVTPAVAEITKRLATRPIFGWLKEALGRGVVSYEDLKELLKQPLFYSLAHKEETYVSFFRKLDKFLEQEFPVMDKSRALFNLRFSNTSEAMYGLLTIGYHSQRHDADVKRNTLNVLCPLSWGNDADWPVIVDPEVSFQPMHYTGTLADHAATEVRFHLQRTMNRVNFDMPVADQLQEYLQDPALVKIIDRRLIEANIHHLVRRVIVSVELPTTFVQSTPTVLRATANFYQNAHPQDPVVSPFVTLELQMDYEEPAFVWSHMVPDFEIIPKAAIEAVVQSEAHAKKFDLKAEAGFQTLTDPLMYSKLAAAPEHNPMHEVKVVEPMPTDRGFDVKIDLDFTDPTVGGPVFFMFEQVMPGIGAKYRELTVLLGQRAGLTGQEEVHLCVEGHVNDKLPGASRLDITLTHKETLSAGTIRTQVHYAFGA